jgi:hypothetical protein
LICIAAREVTSECAPDELPFFDAFVEAAKTARAEKSDPLAFGVTEIVTFFTPHVLNAYQHAAPMVLGAAFTIAADVTKDVLKERIKAWLARRSEPRKVAEQTLNLLPFKAAVDIAANQLMATGIEANRARDLAMMIVSSMLIATSESSSEA